MSSERSARHRSRTHSDPGHSGPFVTPPYTVHRPAPLARQPSRSRSPSVERSFAPSLVAQTSPHRTPVPPRSPPPQRSGHHSRHGSVRLPSGSLIGDLPPPPRTTTNVPFAAASHHHHRSNSARSQSPPAQAPPQDTDVQRHGSHHTSSSAFQNATHVSHHRSGFPSPNTTHHIALPPHSRAGPPNAASHRYASTITPPVYGHGSSASNASRTSLNAATHSHRHVSYHPAYMPSGSPQRSRFHVRAPSSSASRTTATALPVQDAMEILPSPPTSERGMHPSHKLHRSTYRPPLPANYDPDAQTRYVRMLLALEVISPVFNVLAAFFTWILLAGFLLFPGTFASLENEKAGTPQSTIASVIHHIPLYTIAWICTGVGGCGMIWLWWRWYRNYIWINNLIFIPGCLNSAAGIISTLSNVYGAQGGVFGESEKSTIIVTGVISLICGTLAVVYAWLIRRLRKEHDHEVGHEMTGKHGEGFLGEKREIEDGVVAAQII